MKEKITYIITTVTALFIGIIGTIIVENKLTKKSNTTTEPVSNVNITETNTIKTAIDEIYDAVVLVETYNNTTSIATGTGFVYKQDEKKGYIITNHHVIEQGNKFKVVLTTGEEVEATLLGSDEYSDIAVLSIAQENVKKVARLGESSTTEIGDTVFTVGSPLGKEYMGTVTKGILSGKNRTVTINTSSSSMMLEVLQTDAAINPGNSGGPLVNINGEVIGVNSMKLVENEIEGMGFAIPIELVKTILERLENGETINRPLVGIEMTDITNAYYLYRQGISIPKDIEKGVVIINVTDDYPAQKAGLQKGDIIIEINGNEVTDSAHFRYLLYKYEVGDSIEITYYRNNKIEKSTLKLDKSAED